MAKNNRKIASLLISYSMFAGFFREETETPRNQPINLPTKGVKGMTNAELNPIKEGKNKRKRRRKRRKK